MGGIRVSRVIRDIRDIRVITEHTGLPPNHPPARARASRKHWGYEGY